MKEVKRLISTSIIKGSIISVEQGQLIQTPLPLYTCIGDRLSEAQAIRILKREYGKKLNIIIIEISVKENMHTMSIDDFVKHSKIQEKREMPQTMNSHKVTREE